MSFDFEVTDFSVRTARTVHIPLSHVRSVKFSRSMLFFKNVVMHVDPGPWSVKLPHIWGNDVYAGVNSSEEGERFAAAMRERLDKATAPAVPDLS